MSVNEQQVHNPYQCHCPAPPHNLLVCYGDGPCQRGCQHGDWREKHGMSR